MQFLVDADAEDIDELLASVKMTKPHEKTFCRWLAAKQANAAELSAGDLLPLPAGVDDGSQPPPWMPPPWMPLVPTSTSHREGRRNK